MFYIKGESIRKLANTFISIDKNINHMFPDNKHKMLSNIYKY